VKRRPELTHRQVIDKILRRLAEAEQPLSPALDFYYQILRAQHAGPLPDFSDNVASLRDLAPRRLAQGIPMLGFQDLAVNWAALQTLLQKIMEITRAFVAATPEEDDQLVSMQGNRVALEASARAWFDSGTLSSKPSGILPLVASLLQAVLYPLLAAYAEALLPLAGQHAWNHRHCPVCGGAADFAFLEKEKGERWLVCSRCDAQWPFYRIACPCCDNRDHQTLSYHTDDTQRYRLYVCDQCRSYIKAIDLRQASSEVLLPLERVITLDLDRQAYELKYTRS